MVLDWVRMDDKWYPLDIDDRMKPIYEVNTKGEVRNKYTGNILKTHIDKDGYEKYSFQGYGNKKIKYFKHRVVALKFIPGDSSLQVNHIDADKKHNHYSNLEWVTNKENIQHSLNNHLQDFVKGSNHGQSLVSEKEIEIICEYISQGLSTREILNTIDGYFGLEREQLRGIIKHVKAKNSWTHVSDKYF